MSQGSVETETVLKHLSHAGSLTGSPVGQWLVEIGHALKNAIEAGDIVNTPVAYHWPIQKFGRRATPCVIGDGSPECFGSIQPGWEARVRVT